MTLVRPPVWRGILLICTAVALFAGLDATAKYLGRSLPVAEVVWARYLTHFLLMLALLGPSRGLDLVRTRRLAVQVVRALLLVGCSFLFMSSLLYLPLAEASAITFVSPLILTALSVPLLKEYVGPRRWIAVGIGFIGMLIIIRPGGGLLHWAVALPLTMAVMYAFYQLLTRLIANQEQPLTTLFYSAVVGTIATSAVVPFVWHTPTDWLELALLALTGVLGGTGHLALIKAFEVAPASVLAPFTYSQLVWALLLGYLAFGEFPDRWSLIGMAVIVGSGIYVIYRESRPRTQAAGD